MRTIDTRGLSCPQPVLLFHQADAEDAASPMDVLVDNEASFENVTRAAKKKGWNVEQKDEGGGVFRLELRR
ncbi:MAG: sulfurtransferase TusA family protein [Desulfovibrio sp.]|nr:sulfurtransferase TusA family protein [Desulfovibrio sp.]